MLGGAPLVRPGGVAPHCRLRPSEAVGSHLHGGQMPPSVVPLNLSLGLTPNFTSECEQCLGGVTLSPTGGSPVIGIDLSGYVAWPSQR